MNKVVQISKERERSIYWCARKLGISRQGLTWKIEHNSFRDHERAILAAALSVPVEILFPEVVEVRS